MGKDRGRVRAKGGFSERDGTYKGKLKNVEDLVAIKDRKLYNAVGQAISRYHSVLGVRQQSIKLADLSSNTNGVHATNENGESAGIYLNKKLYKNGTIKSISERTKGAYQSGWSTVTNKAVAHTVTHELAHATWNNHLSSKNAKAAGPEIVAMYHSWRNDTNKKGYGKYATTSVNEFWAETVTKAVHGESDKYTKKVKTIIKKYKL